MPASRRARPSSPRPRVEDDDARSNKFPAEGRLPGRCDGDAAYDCPRLIRVEVAVRNADLAAEESESDSRAASDAVQVHGAAGCHASSAVSRYYRDAKLLEIIEGTTQIHEDVLGRVFTERGRKPSIQPDTVHEPSRLREDREVQPH